MDLNETGNSHVIIYPYNQNQNQNHQQNHRSQHHSGRYYPPQPVQYKWEMSQWSECNKLCDGEQFRTSSCIHIDTGRHMSPTLCPEQKPEDEYQVCNPGCIVELVVFSSSRHFSTGIFIQIDHISSPKQLISDGKFNDRRVPLNVVKVFSNYRILAYKHSHN